MLHEGPRDFFKAVFAQSVTERCLAIRFDVKKPVGTDCSGSDDFPADSPGVFRDSVNTVDGRVGCVVRVDFFCLPMGVEKFAESAYISRENRFALF